MMPNRPENLKCCYLHEPNGIDHLYPELSWTVEESHRAEALTAYQIQVYRSQIAHCPGEMVWDSQKQALAGPPVCIYAGPDLQDHTAYRWRVRCWDQSDQPSPFSDWSQFSTGFIHSKWQGTWITTPNPVSFETRGTFVLGKQIGGHIHHHAVYLRKPFSVAGQSPIERAVVYVSGIGYYELRLNGQKVGDHVLDPAQSQYEHFAYYSTFDVTSMIEDQNAFGLILGNGRYIPSYGYDTPRGILELVVTFKDGTTQRVVTDRSWEVVEGPITENGIYHGENYDARRWHKGWDCWDFAPAYAEPAKEVPFIPLKSQMMEPIKIVESLRPKDMRSPCEGEYVYDLGQNITGWVSLKVNGPEGTRVQLRFSELLDDQGRLHTLNMQNARAQDAYILKGDGIEVYEPTFTYHGFRYVEITGYPGVPDLDTIEAKVVHTAVQPTGSFHCEHPLVNQIHQNTLWGQRANLMSIPTDCPQRDERHGWMGDIQLVAEESILNFSMLPFYRKYMTDIAVSQREDGALSDVVPAYYKFFPADPAWGSAYVTIAWELLQHYHDLHTLKTHFPNLQRYVDFLSTIAEDEIIRFGKYGDWCPPGSILPKRTPVALTSTWYYYHDTLRVSEIAQAIGEPEDAELYGQRAKKIKEAFNREFLIKDHYAVTRMSPREGMDDNLLGQTSNALPLALGMVPSDVEQNLYNRLVELVIKEHDYHVDTGIVGTKYIMEVLAQRGNADVAWRMATQESYPSWGYMVREGATTLWERWEKLAGNSMNSHNHIMLGSVDAWFYKYVAGLYPLLPGWKKIGFHVPLYQQLRFASGSVTTPYGITRIEWERIIVDGQSQLKVCVQVPVSCQAQIIIPVCENGQVWESGQTWDKDMPWEGVNVTSNTHDQWTLTLSSGRFEFRSEIEDLDRSRRRIIA